MFWHDAPEQYVFIQSDRLLLKDWSAELCDVLDLKGKGDLDTEWHFCVFPPFYVMNNVNITLGFKIDSLCVVLLQNTDNCGTYELINFWNSLLES